MVEADVHRNNKLIMQRIFYEPNLSLEGVMASLERYIKAEGLNEEGECVLRVRFSNLQKKNV